MPTENWTPSTEEVRGVFASDEFGELKDRWAEEFDRWHQAELRRAKAEAWEAGYNACHEDYQRKTGPLLTPNPHRRGDDE